MELNNTQHKSFLCNKKYDEYVYMMYQYCVKLIFNRL